VIELHYRGWFQCRLATDPDPFDEPRGVSGYVHAYVDEPDLDRVIAFQPAAFTRTHGVDVGVHVEQVVREGHSVPDHPLIGASVDLLDSPKYEGRNGVVADDGLEPVWPFILEISAGDFRLVRAVQPANPYYPYPELFSERIDRAPGEIAQLTGIDDLVAVWRQRAQTLAAELPSAAEPHKSAVSERIRFLQINTANPSGGAARMFGIRMHYTYALAGKPIIIDPPRWLPEAAVAATQPWPVSFWFGGWDADLLCGYTQGVLEIPSPQGDEAQDKASITRRP
jgi:hypothetical protein